MDPPAPASHTPAHHDQRQAQQPSIESADFVVRLLTAHETLKADRDSWRRVAETLEARHDPLRAERDISEANWQSLRIELWEFLNARGVKVPVASKGTENQRLIMAFGSALNRMEQAEAEVKSLRSSRETEQRRAWEGGFELCRSYGDNFVHFEGEQKERHWKAYQQRQPQEDGQG